MDPPNSSIKRTTASIYSLDVPMMQNVLRNLVVTGYQELLLLPEPRPSSGSYFPTPWNPRSPSLEHANLSELETSFRNIRLTSRGLNELVVPIFFKENWFKAQQSTALVVFINHLPAHWRALVENIILMPIRIFYSGISSLASYHLTAINEAMLLMNPVTLLPFTSLTRVHIRLPRLYCDEAAFERLRLLPMIPSLKMVRIIREMEDQYGPMDELERCIVRTTGITDTELITYIMNIIRYHDRR